MLAARGVEDEMADPKVDLIRSVSLFRALGRRELERVAQLMDEIDVPADHVLMRQGDSGNEMFVITSGRVGIDRNGKRISERAVGDAVGEMSLLSEGPRTATVTTLEPCHLLVAGHREFHSLLEDMPTLRLAVLEGLANKIRMLDEAGAH